MKNLINAAAFIRGNTVYQCENERQWKNGVNRNTNISSIKGVDRKFKEASRFTVRFFGKIQIRISESKKWILRFFGQIQKRIMNP